MARNGLYLFEKVDGCIHFPHLNVDVAMGGAISTYLPK